MVKYTCRIFISFILKYFMFSHMFVRLICSRVYFYSLDGKIKDESTFSIELVLWFISEIIYCSLFLQQSLIKSIANVLSTLSRLYLEGKMLFAKFKNILKTVVLFRHKPLVLLKIKSKRRIEWNHRKCIHQSSKMKPIQCQCWLFRVLLAQGSPRWWHSARNRSWKTRIFKLLWILSGPQWALLYSLSFWQGLLALISNTNLTNTKQLSDFNIWNN